MNARIIGKLVAAICLCLALTAILHTYHAKKISMSRDEFVASETARYDRDYTHPRSIATELIGCGILLTLWFGSYELIAFCMTKVVEKANSSDESVPGRPQF